MIQKHVNLSERKLRSLRLRYWKRESRRLRREHAGLLFGAALLIMALMTAYAAVFCAIYCIIGRYFIITDTFTVVYASAAVFLGLMLYGLLFIGGKRLAFSFYGEGNKKNDGINPLFYAFSGKKNFAGSLKILFLFFVHIFWTFAAALAAFVLWRLSGSIAAIVCGTVVILLFLLSAQKHSLEWLFIMKGKNKGESGVGDTGGGYAGKMSRYAMSGRSRESLGASLSAAMRFIIGAALFGVGLLFVYFPYAWTLDAARCACIAEELCSGKGQL